uniref:Uncharacterized protein n=1 Tax=Tetranychus urticae TaxID=32264 RepID=T1K950_TETUR
MEYVTCYLIRVEDDGPVTLDSPITFTVKNLTPDPLLEYRFKFDQFNHCLK